MDELAVTGSTGNIGGRVARLLSAAGVPQRLVVRDPTRAPTLSGTTVVRATYADGEAARRALDGIGTLFMVSGSEAPDRLDQHRTFVDAAVAAGVARIVYLSFYNAAADSTFTLARDHWATEEHIRANGVRHTFLRDNLYADFLPYLVGEDNVIRGPAGDGRAAVVAQDDIAEVAATVLGQPGRHDDVTYDLTGPESLTFHEIAERLGVRYHPETVAEAYASRAGYGAPGWQVDAWVSTYTAVAAGELAGTSADVQRLTGHPARTLTEVLAASR
ncbi:MAG: SDR family oxidoreductase [Actinobacteria bacterium]|nr:MAG: SDR family oxidoreductase [Actinomycetota bacterium]